MRQLVIILFTLLLFSCNNNHLKRPGTSNDTSIIKNKATDSIVKIKTDSTSFIAMALLPWDIDFEKKTKKANPDFNAGNLNADSVMTGLNQLFPEIKLEKVKLRHDTLFTIVRDSYYLTDGMGTTGAATYFATAVINLTSVKGITHVQIDFRQGSHASPDTWSKNEFNDYTVIH